MAKVYVNRGYSFEYNLQLGTKSVVEFTDGTLNDLSSIDEIGPQPEEPDEPEPDEPDDPDTPQPDVPDPENPPDVPDTPVNPEPQPEPEPEPDKPNTITIESKCTSTTQKANNDHPTRHVTTASSGFCLTQWHSDFEKCIAYAKKTGVPLFYVWSNGSKCGHCWQFEDSVKNSAFVNFMKKNKLIWCFTTSSDPGHQRGSSFAYLFGYGKGGNSYFSDKNMQKKIKQYRSKEKGLLAQFPFCGLYWYHPYLQKPKIIYDEVEIGDMLDGGNNGRAGANSSIKWLNKKIKNFKKYGYDVSTATFTIS